MRNAAMAFVLAVTTHARVQHLVIDTLAAKLVDRLSHQVLKARSLNNLGLVSSGSQRWGALDGLRYPYKPDVSHAVLAKLRLQKKARLRRHGAAGSWAQAGAGDQYRSAQGSDAKPEVSVTMDWRIYPPRDWDAFKAELGAPKDMEDLKERLRTNLMHFTGNYVAAAYILATAIAFPDVMMCAGLFFGALSAVCTSDAWVNWLDKWLRAKCNASTGIATDVVTLKRYVTIIMSPAPEPPHQEKGLITAEQVKAEQPETPTGTMIMSMEQPNLVTFLRSLALVTFIFATKQGWAALLMSLVLTTMAALVHASLKPPTLGSAFTRLVNAETREDLDYAVGVMGKKAKAEFQKFWGGLGKKQKKEKEP
eukprot:gnl/MRDRNA2_/MRDRNA2_94025_c0_seq1.p1 gnl/MRDRNA2_/MRDRNA2_94025_c0~~gnl/MRDRNA2_/MRDRNA2_94025_c0_seq1.p1  ORF type:complete len:365 (+),score=65.99 gnl/MRDRNA2_/MRDRNA2_94025_c0_seq1:116-1210(+)